jgi:hypothetical protein
MLRLEPLLTAQITLGAPQELGDTPQGRRRIIPITGGKFHGARLYGRVLPGGADWQVLRGDGVAQLEARYTLETSEGALIYVQNIGLRHGPAEIMERLAKGDAVLPELYYMRTTPSFETSNSKYTWLNRIVCVGTGARRPDCVDLEIFEVR